ncbi:MAG: IS3 family transposase [Vulcanimicrobiaceae bacterium]
MRKRHSPDQIATALRQAEAGTPVAEIVRKLGIHENTFYIWRRRYGGLGTPEVRELRQLREENAKLKQIVADLSLDRKMLQEIIAKKPVKPAQQRERVGFLVRTFGVGIRRACDLIQLNRATYYCKSKAGPLNGILRERIKEIAAARVRYGYRRISVLLRREGFAINDKRVYRLYALEGLSLRAKMPHRRRAATPRSERFVPQMVDELWAMDFMHDRLSDGRSYRLLTVLDVYSRECVALEVAPRFCSNDVVKVLQRVSRERAAPKMLRCDNGAEFVAQPMDQWAFWNKVTLDFSRPGKPTDNAFIESFNGGVRRELLNPSYFETIEDVRRAARIWRQEYNIFRPHSMLANKTPKEFADAARSQSTSRFSPALGGLDSG